MIRPATAADFPAVERMARDFDAAVGLDLGGPWSSAQFRGLFDRLVGDRRGLALVLDRPEGAGVLLAGAAPAPFRPALWADEIMFWIDPPARGRWAGAMLDQYETWARDLGATLAGLSSLDERAGRLFARRGYVPAERKYLRRL